jgi:hypothetical protein
MARGAGVVKGFAARRVRWSQGTLNRAGADFPIDHRNGGN